MNKITIIITLVATLAASNAFALRCGGELVYEEDKVYQVIEKCGEPDYATSDAWGDKATMVYDNGDGSSSEVEILNDRVINIDSSRN